ncbi:MAG: ComF family protein [Chromatiaceae bacterium]|jgi:ComF family protein
MLAAENGEISAPGPAILCGDCLSQAPAFDRALAPLLYQFPVDGLVAGFKYHHRLHWGRILGDLLADHLAQNAAPPGLLLPVPATAARLRERGFNQAAELARRLSLRLGIPWRTGLLLRIREAVHQQGLSGPQRRRNMRGAFACRGRLPARVALIDDVITTGATAGAASAALKDAGVEWVEVWAVARTPKGH